MNDSNTDPETWANRNAKKSLHLLVWTFVWVLSTALAAFGPKLLWDFATVPTILAVLLNVGVGFGMILATKRHVHGLDELQQRIFLDAGALSLGVGLVFGIAYELLEDIKLIPFEPEISHLVILMTLTFLAGTIAGNRKYR
jgi:hypothetical protein